MVTDLKHRLSSVLDEDVHAIELFTKGQIGDIYRVVTSKESYIIKTSKPSDLLKIEANMLDDLKKFNVAVPKVFDVSDTHLLMEYIEPHRHSPIDQEAFAAKRLLQLHDISNESRMYGYYYDTTIGPFRQKNEQTQYNWALFLAQMRILPMAKLCYEKVHIDKKMMDRLERLCNELYKRIDMSSITPSLLHGDVWGGNVLYDQKGAVLIDPAIYFGDREMELAFILMFNTFGSDFFNIYSEVNPLSSDFESVKVPLYQIYPTLVHVALYGSSYIRSLEALLKRLNA